MNDFSSQPFDEATTISSLNEDSSRRTEDSRSLLVPEGLHERAVRFFELDHANSDNSDATASTTAPSTETSSIKEPLTWLSDELSLANSPNAVPTFGRIRLAIVDFDPELQLQDEDSKSIMVELLSSLQIPLAAYTEYNVVKSQKFPPTLEECKTNPAKQVQSQGIFCETWGIAWKFFPQSLTSIGVAWSMDRDGRDAIDWIILQATKLRPALSHPSLLSLLVLQNVTTAMRHSISVYRAQVEQAQLDSGFHQYVGLEYGEARKDVDLGKFSASVSGISSNLLTCQLLVRGLHNLSMCIIKDNASFANNRNAVDDLSASYITSYIEQEAQYWRDECAFLLQKAISWQAKASVVIQGIFNLIAQRDSIVNVNIAKESKNLAEQSQRVAYESKILAEETKKDSTSMKAIAAVTMFFLPGTFVAVSQTILYPITDVSLIPNSQSLFATPMFQWNLGSDQISHHYLWLYWAVTIPLTVLTISIWVLWDWLSNKKSKLSTEDEDKI